jgi:ligand-binding SRPBCC domain-containing protein
MKFFIKKRPDDTATLMTESGQVVWTFSSMQEAIQRCTEEWAVANGESKPAGAIDFEDRFNDAA